MKFRELSKTSRLNEGKGKFKLERLDGDDDEDLVIASTEITLQENSAQGIYATIVLYYSVVLDLNDSKLRINSDDEYCEIKGYCGKARALYESITDGLYKCKTPKEAIKYLKSL